MNSFPPRVTLFLFASRLLPAVPFAGQVALARATLVADEAAGATAAGPRGAAAFALPLAVSLVSSAVLVWLLLRGTAALLTDEEVAGFSTLIAAAGSETVTKLVGSAVVLFHRNPDEWAKVLGAKVIGVVGSAAKAAIARKNGCAHVLVQGRDPIVDAVKKITKGKGVAVVYDSLGKDTFFESLDCLAPLGMMVSYGNATGPAPSFSPLELSKRGSLFITRPSLFAYIATRSDLDAAARETFRVIASGKVKLRINQKYALKDAAQAHRDLEARKTTGSTVLIPPSA